MLAESVGRPTMVVNLWASLAYGLVLLLTPDLFCDILQADAVNTAWLRTIGAALLGTNVLGSWLWLREPSLDMGRVQTTTAGLEAAARLRHSCSENSQRTISGWSRHPYSLH